MSPTVIGCCLLVFNFFNFNLDQTFNFLEPIKLSFESFFHKNPLPIQTEKAKSYTIAMVGDSMTQFFGSAEVLKASLKKYYPDREFGILNFGIGSTNILSVPDRLTKESKRENETLPPILDAKPYILFLESFGNNPLSHLKINEGLKKQTETLDQIVKIIKEKQPNTVLVFVATIAPSKERYAEGVTNLMPDQRRQWAEERMSYIENHINYAKSHNIPLVNVYKKSFNEKGEANIDYVNSVDFIHPSVTGIQFIGDQIADKVYKDQIIRN